MLHITIAREEISWNISQPDVANIYNATNLYNLPRKHVLLQIVLKVRYTIIRTQLDLCAPGDYVHIEFSI